MARVGDALKRPLEDEQWWKKIGIGGLLLLLPVVNFIPIGYLMRVYREYLEGGEEADLPEWRGIGSLFVDGFYGFLVFVGYMVPFAVFLILSMLASEMAALCYIFAFLGFLAFLIGLFLLPIGVAAYLKHGLLSSAFQVGTVGPLISSVFGQYFLEFLECLAILILAGGTWPFVSFLLFLSFAELLGRVVAETFGAEPAAA